ncbi:bifunctional oligoribonuclease/PAP phosphatase NrnA [Patescibacteria group bacterium]
MSKFQKEFEKALKLIKKSNDILIVSHKNPDGDTVGSNLSLRQVLISDFGKNVTSACVDPLPNSLLFLADSNIFENKIDPNKHDLIITVDASSIDQLKFAEIDERLLKSGKDIINIDHHPTNKKFGTLNIVDENVSCATEILYYFFEFIGATIAPNTATYLLAGLYNDTGSFMHSNTSPSSYKMASKLLEAGAALPRIVKHMFKTQSVEQLRLWGKVLSNARMNKKGTLVSKVTNNDFYETNSSPRDLMGVINYLNSVSQSNLSVLLSEDMKGHVKGSMRTVKDDVDVASLCEKLGGGGHKKAAGFTIPGKIVTEEVWRIEE